MHPETLKEHLEYAEERVAQGVPLVVEQRTLEHGSNVRDMIQKQPERESF